MAELSPYLNENPIDRAFTLGQYTNTPLSRGDSGELFIEVNGRAVHSSGILRRETLLSHVSTYKFYRRPKDKVRVKYRHFRMRLGFLYQSYVPVPFSMQPSNKGQTSITISGRMPGLSRLMLKAQSRAKGRFKWPFSSIPRANGSSTLRPSPEIISRPFLRVHQTSAGVNSQTVVPFTKYYREWSGVRTPGFGSKKKRTLPDNPHSVRIVDVTEQRYSWYQTQPSTGGYDLRIFPFYEVYEIPDPPVIFIDEAESRSLKKLISQANQGINANMAQNIAQINQLSSLILGATSRMATSLRALRRGNIPLAVSALTSGRSKSQWQGPKGNPSIKKSLAQNWLQLQYGWKPLLSDIDGFFKALNVLHEPQSFVTRVSSSASAMRQYTSDYPPGNGLIGFENHGKTTFLVRTQVKFKIRFKVASPFTNFMSQTGFTNPINLFWEILPFSFVADWFLPIGTYLEHLRAWDGLTFVGGSKVQFSKIWTDSAISYGGPAVGEPTVNIQLIASSRREEIRLERTGLTAFPSPVLPSFNFRGLETGSRAANGIALLLQAFR